MREHEKEVFKNFWHYFRIKRHQYFRKRISEFISIFLEYTSFLNSLIKILQKTLRSGFGKLLEKYWTLWNLNLIVS